MINKLDFLRVLQKVIRTTAILIPSKVSRLTFHATNMTADIFFPGFLPRVKLALNIEKKS